jgi:predicted transposase YdaD
LCLDHPTEEILEEEKAIILGLEVTDERRQELLALAIMLGRRQFSEAVLQRMFQEELPMLKQLSFVEEWIADGVREGFTEGRAEGRTEEARQNLLKVLHHCFGVVPTELESRVRTADAAWCENVIDLAFSAKSPVELMQQVTPSIQ